MKNKSILVLFIIGMVLTVTGVIFKNTQSDGASFFLIVGMTFNSVAGIALIFKLLKKDKDSNGFLDS